MISAVVQTGSTILRSECSDTLSVVSALAAGARTKLAASAEAERTGAPEAHAHGTHGVILRL